MCTTTVEDVPLTTITIPNGMFQSYSGSVTYEVINGIAFLYFNIRNAKFANTMEVGDLTIPKVKSPFSYTIISENLKCSITVVGNGNYAKIWNLGDTTNTTNYLACISYPVAES